MPKRKSATARDRKSRRVKHSKTEISPLGIHDGTSSSVDVTSLDFCSQENTSSAECLEKPDGALDCVPSSKGTVIHRRGTPPRPCRVRSREFPEAQGSVEQKSADSKSSIKTCPKDKTVKPIDDIPKQDIGEPASPGKTSRIHISKPELVFTDIYKRRTCLTDDGSKLQIGNMTMIGYSDFRTNGRFQTGRQYWEMKISVPLNSPRPVFFDICVSQERGDVGTDSWYLRVGYHRGKIKCSDYCGGNIERGYHKWRPYSDPHHLGVLLNCEERTFAVLDPAENRLMFTVRDVQVSEPLVPSVRCGYLKHASVELITGEAVTLPQVLCEMLNSASESFN